MKNKTIGNLILTSIGLAVFTGMFVTDFETSETMYMIAGFGFMIFGTWGAIRLRK
jgi:putative Ca2+/H+ antiporter (TMEM165/GDT1 family)